MRGSITKAVYFLSDQDLLNCVRLLSDSGQLLIDHTERVGGSELKPDTLLRRLRAQTGIQRESESKTKPPGSWSWPWINTLHNIKVHSRWINDYKTKRVDVDRCGVCCCCEY